MLNAAQIRSHVNALSVITNLTPTHFIVTAGSAAVMHGIRETTADIDLDVNVEVWERLNKSFPGLPVTEGLCGQVMSLAGIFDIHPVTMDETFQTTNINDTRVLTLESLRDQYIMLATHEKRPLEKVRRDNDTVLAIQKRMDHEHLVRPIASVREAVPLLKNILDSKFDLLRLATFFSENSSEIVVFSDNEHRTWYAYRTYGAQADLIRLCRTVDVEIEVLHHYLAHPRQRETWVKNTRIDQQIEIALVM